MDDWRHSYDTGDRTLNGLGRGRPFRSAKSFATYGGLDKPMPNPKRFPQSETCEIRPTIESAIPKYNIPTAPIFLAFREAFSLL